MASKTQIRNNDKTESKLIENKIKSIKNHKSHRSQSCTDNSDSREERKTKRNLMQLIGEKNDQIEKLIKRVTTLHSLNNEFASEYKRIQNQMLSLQQQLDYLKAEQQKECNSCREFAKQKKVEHSEMTKLITNNKQLLDDSKMMKTLIYRLNMQLERYQERLRKCPPNDGNEIIKPQIQIDGTLSTIHKSETTHWGTFDTHMLAPLLNAYQETINEKTELIKQYEMALNQCTGQIRDILMENEQMHTEMDNMKRMNDTWLSEKARLQAQLDVCRNKAEIHSKRADLAKEKLIEVLRCYETKMQAQSIDMERLQEAYSRTKGELITCKNIHQQPEAVVESLKECEKLFKTLKIQHDQEKVKLVAELSEIRDNHHQMETEKQKQNEEMNKLESIIQLHKDKIEMQMIEIDKLHQKLNRIRQSRDTLDDRLKNTVTWNKNMKANAKAIQKISWQGLRKIEQLLRQKDVQLQQLNAQHSAEMEKLQRKLKRKDEIIKKILLNKAK